MTPTLTIRLAARPEPIEQAAALAAQLQSMWTAAELRANARLIDQILAKEKQ